MSVFKFFPEGWKKDELLEKNEILQGIVERCDENFNLYVKLKDGKEGIVPRKEIDYINFDENGMPKANFCAGKVHKYIQFKIKEENENNLILSRKDVQEEVVNFIKTNLQVGENLNGIVKNITPYGAFIDIGGGVVGLVHIEDLSVARIKSPYERLKIGQEINVRVKNINKEEGRVDLSYKEQFGSWKENADKFSVGMKIKGIVRETEKNKNGIFIELTPNLVGMAEYRENLNYGEKIDVIIKKIDYEKQKVKLIVM